MGKKYRIINNIFILFSKWIEFKKPNPVILVGSLFFTSGLALLGGKNITSFFVGKNSPKGDSYFLGITVSNNTNQLLDILALVFLILGAIILIFGLIIVSRLYKKRTFYYLSGMNNQSEKHPLEALPKTAKLFQPNLVSFKLDTEDPSKLKEKLNYHLEIISEKIEQTESDKTYFAGIARIPYLYFIGYGFRNAHSSVILLEHSHQTTNWFRLKDTDEVDLDLSIINKEQIQPNDKKDVGVAIEFSCEIPDNEFPEFLKDHIYRIRLNKGVSHNQINSQIALNRIVDDIIKFLIALNKTTNTIHLFITAQASLVFSLGRRYQEGMMGNIQVYNYNGNEKKYTWAFKIEKSEIKLAQDF